MKNKVRNTKRMKKSLSSSLPSLPSVKGPAHRLTDTPAHRFPSGNAKTLLTTATLLTLITTGCQILSYSSPTGERFTRRSFGANTSISSLSVESGTNGLRRLHLHGYQNDSSQALGTVTEAAVRGAVQAAKP